MFKKYKGVILILSLAAFLRLILLQSIPSGITPDELDYVLNAKTLFLTGSDISATWNPFLLKPAPYEYPKGETAYHLMAPLVGPTSFSLFSARLANVIGGVVLVFLVYLITKNLIGLKEALVAGLIMAINPWAIFFSRTAYDTPLSVLFYFAALYVLLTTKSKRVLFSIPLLFFAFFGYVGTKLILLPFVLTVVLYAYFYLGRKKLLRYYITIFIASLIFLLVFVLNSSSLPGGGRVGDIFTPFSPQIEKEVVYARQTSLESPFTPIFSNKLTIFGREFLTKYINSFSPDILFVNGEQTAFYSFRHQGFFYFLDLIFLIVGLFVLLQKKKSTVIFLLILTFIAALPSALSSVGTSYSIRSSATIPLLVIFISVGASYFIYHKKHGRFFTIFFVLVYTALTLNFLHNYFLEQPFYNSEKVNFSARVLAKYVTLAGEKGINVKVVKTTPQESLINSYVLKPYLFYNNAYNHQSKDQIAKAIRENSKSYENIYLVDCKDLVANSKDIVVMLEGTCINNLKQERLTIAQLIDGGSVYDVFDDVLCKNYNLKRYPERIELTDLAVERMGQQKFCETFVTKLE